MSLLLFHRERNVLFRGMVSVDPKVVEQRGCLLDPIAIVLLSAKMRS